jgi:hypothetical protein
MSSIGRPFKGVCGMMQSILVKIKMKIRFYLLNFLYGHILEEVLLLLVELAGHKATDKQKQVNLNGVKGHIDCKIDNENYRY